MSEVPSNSPPSVDGAGHALQPVAVFDGSQDDAEPQLYLEAARLFDSLVSKLAAPGVGLAVWGVIRNHGKSKSTLSTWSLIGHLLVAAVILAATVYFGCLVVIAVRRAKSILFSEVPNALPASSPQNPPMQSGADGERYWLLREGRATGPFSVSALREAAASGDFSGETPVCLVGGACWTPLRSVAIAAPSAVSAPEPPALSADGQGVEQRP